MFALDLDVMNMKNIFFLPFQNYYTWIHYQSIYIISPYTLLAIIYQPILQDCCKSEQNIASENLFWIIKYQLRSKNQLNNYEGSAKLIWGFSITQNNLANYWRLSVEDSKVNINQQSRTLIKFFIWKQLKHQV